MGRTPCCDKINGVKKKGPWTPEEDIILVSYIQQYGPGNWTSVPTNTGLLRCSKSCRMRWTNYLRPGVKRGNFTDQEEKLIIHLQALLGNRWATIASYLPERTDNDIKNYYNTHLKKRLPSSTAKSSSSISRGQWERRLQADINLARKALQEALDTTLDAKPSCCTTLTPPAHSPSVYASSTENISRLLEGWMGSTDDRKSASGMSESTATSSESKPSGLVGGGQMLLPQLCMLETWSPDHDQGMYFDNLALDGASVLL